MAVPPHVRNRVLAFLPLGYENAIPGAELARLANVPYRTVQEAAAALIDLDGIAVGSLCGRRPGFYRMRPGHSEDFSRGVAHSVRRASAIFARIRALEAIRERDFPGTSRLFNPESLDESA